MLRWSTFILRVAQSFVDSAALGVQSETRKGNEMAKVKRRPVVVTNHHRGIYFGHIVAELEGGNAVKLEGCRVVFSYQCLPGHEGIGGLASGGPGPRTKACPPVDAKIRDVANVMECSAEAAELWDDAKWG